ncbi:MAG: ribbon-helix-helix protein, CopG family [Burkholderiaceae bacterium]
MGRILVNLSDQQISDLKEIQKIEHVSRTEIIRRAVAAYVERNKPSGESVFGIWKDRKVDGLAYQEAVRSEW